MLNPLTGLKFQRVVQLMLMEMRPDSRRIRKCDLCTEESARKFEMHNCKLQVERRRLSSWTFCLQATACSHVTVGGIWCVEEVGDHHGQETGLKRDFDSSRTFGSGPLLCQRCRRRREETACKRKRTEISLVFVTIMLHVLTYVVSNKLFWNWYCVVPFVSQEVWFDKGFVIWNFRNYCSIQIV